MLSARVRGGQERTAVVSAATTTTATVGEREMARRTQWMSLVVLTHNLIPVLWVCKCSSASTCREASDALSKSSANYTCLLRRLHAGYSSHLDSWHGRQEPSNRCRPVQRHLRDIAVSLDILLTSVCRAVPYQQARLTSTANGCQRIAVWHHEV